MIRLISLNGDWDYKPQAHVMLKPDNVFEENTDNLPSGGKMTLPVNWQLGGLDNFHGRVQFERTFTFDGLNPDEASVWLTFKAVDYYAKVWLNGQLLGEHEGYFQPFSFDVTDVIQAGENTLTVDVNCPKEEPETLWPDHKVMLKGVLSHWDCRPGSWDGETGQDKNSGGIWNDVYLETRPATYIDYTRITTKLLPDGIPEVWIPLDKVDPEDFPKQAMVTVDCDLVGLPGEYELSASIGDKATVEQAVTLKRSGERHTVIVPVSDPELWWTWDLGEPHLENCVIQLKQADRVVFEKQVEIGLREVTLDYETGQWFLNGKRFFVRGTNVIPTLWLSEYDEAMIGKDIEMLREAHVNGVRVCVHINRDEFYTACDHAGILVWQDFAFQWGYTATHEFTQEAIRQIKDMVRLLVNHPSIALWCTQNESGLYNDHVLAPMMADAIAGEDTSRYINPVSSFAEHTYPGWYGGHYRDYINLDGLSPVISEFGAQALPDIDSVKEMFGEAWPPDWDLMGYHDFQYDQTFNIAGVEMGNNWEEFVENSQSYQAKLLKYALENFRKAKYEKMGGLFQFMFMDCWPSVTWSVVGYNRVPKKGYYVLQQCYQRILIGLPLSIPDKILAGHPNLGSRYRVPQFHPWVVNDTHEKLENCHYTVMLKGPQGDYESSPSQKFDVPADGVRKDVPVVVLPLPEDTPLGKYTIVITLKQGDAVLSVNEYPIELGKVE